MQTELEKKLCFDNRRNIYQEIRDEIEEKKLKLYIWGVGSVAVGAAKALAQENINISGFFTDIPEYFVDPRLLGEKVYHIEEICAAEDKFLVVMGHSYYEFANKLKKYKNVQSLYFLPMVTRADIAISSEIIRNNLVKLQDVYDKLGDELSRSNMIDYLNTHLSGDESHIMKNFAKKAGYFDNDIIELNETEVYLDVGAYDGKSINDFIQSVNGNYDKILAIEVMTAECRGLMEKFADNSKIVIVETGVSNHEGIAYFDFDNQSTCLTSDRKSGVPVQVTTLDLLCEKIVVRPTVMKICIGNSIVPILQGAERIINSALPKLVITAGIDKYALINYIPEIEKIAGIGAYRFYLRFTSAMSECLVLFCIPNKK